MIIVNFQCDSVIGMQRHIRALLRVFLIRIKGGYRGRGRLQVHPSAVGVHMAKPFPLSPKHPERICWGCDRYCPASALACGNGADRTMHPAEMIGEDWYLHGDWGLELTDITDKAADESGPPNILTN